jgi:hypothetical protein
LTREELEREIAAVSRDIDILNQKIAEVIEFAKERGELRNRMTELLKQYLGESFREQIEDHKQVFVFKGKIKDLSAALQDEIRKV